MKVIIIGAGEVGCGLAETLCLDNTQIVMLDCDAERLASTSEKLDINTQVANGTRPADLIRAGVEGSDLIVAVTSSTEINVLSCVAAKRLQPNIRTICRINDPDFFNGAGAVTATSFGIDHLVIPQNECAKAITEIVRHQEIKEMVHLSHHDAVVAGLHLLPGSPMVGTQPFSFPRPDLLEKNRFCAIWRRGRLVVPRGKERFNNYDEVYVAGAKAEVLKLGRWSRMEETPLHSVVIAGATSLGLRLAQHFIEAGVKVSVIEPSAPAAEHAVAKLGDGAQVLHASPASSDILEEADTPRCDVFIACTEDDENNVLTALLARRVGARRTIVVINKADYREIVSSMEAIDCCFSPRIAALNTIINLIQGSSRRVGAILHRISAEIHELIISPGSPAEGRMIRDCQLPPEASLPMILRGSLIVPVSGNETLQVGDTLVAMGPSAALRELAGKLQPRKKFFS